LNYAELYFNRVEDGLLEAASGVPKPVHKLLQTNIITRADEQAADRWTEYNNASRISKQQATAINQLAIESEVYATIHGRGRPIAKPTLYAVGYTHGT
jgi:hypothetical protein